MTTDYAKTYAEYKVAGQATDAAFLDLQREQAAAGFGCMALAPSLLRRADAKPLLFVIQSTPEEIDVCKKLLALGLLELRHPTSWSAHFVTTKAGRAVASK